MTQDDIIRMAREAGWTEYSLLHAVEVQRLETFAALVAAEKEQQMTRDGWRQCAKGQRTTQFCGLLDAAVKAEREACAKYVEGVFDMELVFGSDIAAAIRARGEV
jgi:hypothetical protein